MSRGIAEACHSCVIAQAQSAAEFAQLTPRETARVVTVAWRGIRGSKRTGKIVQQVVRDIADTINTIRHETRDFDIYADVKDKSNRIALKYVSKLRGEIEESPNPLETAVQIAAAGNIIDFGAKQHGSLDLEKEINTITDVEFDRFDINHFTQKLESAKQLLYICDNSGEIVCDSLLIETIQNLYPEIKIVAAVREKPIINDATMKDARDVSLIDLVDVISSGSIYPGTVLKETNEEFHTLFDTADLILSKGQGNFETLLPVQNDRLFFLLRIKCEHMATLSGVEKGNLVLLHGK
jgi:uncharacterized protein with ATP-grasp and redox domains